MCMLSHVMSCPTLCDPMDYSPPGSSVRGIFQARILEWVAMPSSKGSSQPRDQTRGSCISDGVLYKYQLSLSDLMLQCFPDDTSGKEPTCQCRKHKGCEFDTWVRKIPWRRARQLTPVFLPGESYEQGSLVGYSP